MEVDAVEGTTQGASYNAAKAPEGIAQPEGILPKIVEHYLIQGMSWMVKQSSFGSDGVLSMSWHVQAGMAAASWRAC